MIDLSDLSALLAILFCSLASCDAIYDKSFQRKPSYSFDFEIKEKLAIATKSIKLSLNNELLTLGRNSSLLGFFPSNLTVAIENIVENGLKQSKGVTKYPNFPLYSSVSRNSTSGEGVCMDISSSYSPMYICSGVVDYPFFVPNGTTLEDLEAEARAMASFYPSFLSATCLSAVKRLICASVFNPCTSDGTGAAMYELPCKSLCTDTTYLGTSCLGYLEALEIAPVCDSGAYVPDGSGFCNDLSQNPAAQGQIVADAAEPYIGETCVGITTGFYVMPPTSLGLAPLLPPFVEQMLIEAGVSQLEALIPRYLTSKCLDIQREITCASYFLQPYENRDLEESMGIVMQLPSFPSRSICEAYYEACPLLIQTVPLLALNCTGTLPGSNIHTFPVGDQVIAYVPLGDLIVPLSSPPNTLANSSFSLTSECPQGLVSIDGDPSFDPALGLAISGTACALQCPTAIYTPEEYSALYFQNNAALYFALGMAMLQIVNISVIKPAKQNIFLVGSIISTFFFIFLQVLQIFLVPNRESLLCSTSATWHSLSASRESVSATLCSVTAIIALFQDLLGQWILFGLSSEIWVRVVLGVKNVDFHRRFYLWGTLLLLLLLFFLKLFYGQPNVTHPGTIALFCVWTATNKNTQFYLADIPGIANLCISSAMVYHALYVCARTSLRVQDSENKPLRKLWRAYGMLFMFSLLEIAIYPITFFYYHLYISFVHSHVYVDSLVAWVACMFTYFNNAGDDTYIEVCGAVPSVRPSLSAILDPGLAAVYTTAIVLFVITLNKEAKGFWRGLFSSVLHRLGLEDAFKCISCPTWLGSWIVAGKRALITSVSYYSSRFSESIGERSEHVSDSESIHGSVLLKKSKDFPRDKRKDSYALNMKRLWNVKLPGPHGAKVAATMSEQALVKAEARAVVSKGQREKGSHEADGDTESDEENRDGGDPRSEIVIDVSEGNRRPSLELLTLREAVVSLSPKHSPVSYEEQAPNRTDACERTGNEEIFDNATGRKHVNFTTPESIDCNV